MSTWTLTHDDSRWSAYFTLAADPVTPNQYIMHLYLYEQLE